MSERLDVRKTYKLLINGAFVRSESGRSYEVRRADGEFWANVAQGSRKDVRDAVKAARSAQATWWKATAYNRGQVLFRLAEMAEARRDELARHVAAAEGVDGADALGIVARGIDRIVWYAGWTDKVAQVLGGANPVAGPFFNFSLPVPSGVVGVLAPQESSFEGFVDTVLAPLAVGNAVVVATSESRPTPGLLLGEMSATSDFPAGVLNVISGVTRELAPTLASHEDVDGLDLAGAGGDHDELAASAAASIKRVRRAGERDYATSSTSRLRSFVETSTVWHTIGR
ncbi:MAG: aldehyde dehydrogenase family protein [Acidobacteriota bacterium]|nr:aldehyde dehydrogenase family protein [Acidobacteriota bacterium]